MLFANGTKGLRLDRERLKLEVVPVADQNSIAADILVHDETNKSIAQLLIDMPFGSFPMALGVIYCDPMSAFDSAVIEQNHKASPARCETSMRCCAGEILGRSMAMRVSGSAEVHPLQ